MGVRCTSWCSRDAHRPVCISDGAVTSCGFATRSAVAQEPLGAWRVATPQSEGLVRVRGRVCLRTIRPRPLGVATEPTVRPGRVSSAASRRRRTRWPAHWPSGCPASPITTGTRLFRLAVWPSRTGLMDWSDPRRGLDSRAHPNGRRAVPSARRAGSLPPRPHTPERHRRSCGRGTTVTRAATCGASARAHGHGDTVHMPLDVDVHARYATRPRLSAVRNLKRMEACFKEIRGD